MLLEFIAVVAKHSSEQVFFSKIPIFVKPRVSDGLCFEYEDSFEKY